MKKAAFAILCWCYAFLSLPGVSADNNTGGEVHVPLAAYQALLEATQVTVDTAPAAYGVSESRVTLAVRAYEHNYSATVNLAFSVQVYENTWVAIPLLPIGTALTKAEVNGQTVQLMSAQRDLAWVTQSAGTYQFELAYEVDARSSASGFTLPIALVQSASTQLLATLPLSQADVTLIPAVSTTTEQRNGRTQVRAHIPAQRHVALSWTRPILAPYVISRAQYHGEREGEALQFQAEYWVDVFQTTALLLPLLPKSVTLHDVLIDGEQAIVLVQAGNFATRIQGQGQHKVTVKFQVPIVQDDGPPAVQLAIPEVPVSHFEITLPGKKEVSVSPAANVVSTFANAQTRAVVNIPMTQQVRFAWGEAIPEDIKDELRANASLYHSLHAEEGVLHGKAVIVYEITRGETASLDILVPASVQINRIESPTGGVSDWRVGEAAQGYKAITVFLDRKIKGEFVFHVFYERLLSLQALSAKALPVPLIKAAHVHRQRGMVALLSSAELTLKPMQAERITKVGENQLPGFVRQGLNLVVAHTYKYADDNPVLSVQGVAPEHKRGKFDAQVDTLVSIGEVTLKGAATIAVTVKSGSVMSLQLKLPLNVSVLGLSGPSLRTYHVQQAGAFQTVEVDFTQELAGQFRLDLNYERILSEVGQDTAVPTVSVLNADIEHGRIAVEALSAVEVQATQTEQLSSVDVNELPQQLVLKTTNPILLAYRYVHVEPPYALALKVTRHQELDVQVATIEHAQYRTLVTGDGLAVTTADFRIRNSRKQFLRLQLPEKSEVWSVFVEGKAEKPAQATDAKQSVLIKMMNSTRGFSMQVVYATRLSALQDSGDMRMVLPQPDMVVTHSTWDVYLPDDRIYTLVQTNMERGIRGPRVDFKHAAKAGGGGAIQVVVPMQGRHFSLNKLYANQADQDTYVRFEYTSQTAQLQGTILGVIGVVLFALGALRVLTQNLRVGPASSLLMALGALGTGLAHVWLSALPGPSVVAAVLLGGVLLVAAYRAYRRR